MRSVAVQTCGIAILLAGIQALAQRPAFRMPSPSRGVAPVLGSAPVERSFSFRPDQALSVSRQIGINGQERGSGSRAATPGFSIASLFQAQPNRRVIFFPPWWLYTNPFAYYGPRYWDSYSPNIGYGPWSWGGDYGDRDGRNLYPQGESTAQGPNYKDFLNTAPPPPPSASDARPLPQDVVTTFDGREQHLSHSGAPLAIGSGLHTLRISARPATPPDTEP